MINESLWALVALTILVTSSMAAETRPATDGGGPRRGPSGPLAADEVSLLLSRLDLDRPGLEKVKAAAGDPQKAAGELLDYYRARTSVRHPEVDRTSRLKVRGQYASPEELAIADDALKNILIAAWVYPRFDFGEKIDWKTNRGPKGDIEWIVQLHRHYSWAPLGKAYWHTSDEKYAAAYVRQLLDWIASCPPPPAEKERLAWGRIEVGIRGYGWTGHFNYFLDSPHYTPEVLVRQLNSLYDHAALLVGSPFTNNNWGLMEAEGAAYIAMTFPEFKSSDVWRKKGIQFLGEQINQQVLPDGMQDEMCFGYHSGSILWFVRTLDLAELNGRTGEFPPNYSKTVERMYEVLGLCAHPNGYNTMFGDDRGHNDETPELKPMRRGEKGFPGSGPMREGARRFPDNATLKFLATGDPKIKPPPTALALSSAGLCSLRSDWSEQAIHLIMKCGHDGGWHCHPDNGTFEIFAYGRYLMPDSGCYIYHGDVAGRKWFRQTRVHQTLTLGGKDAAYKAALLLWQPGEDLDAVVVENGSYTGLTHRRAVLFVKKKFFILVDEAVGKAAGNVDLHFQIAPGKPVIDPAAASARTDFVDGGANVLIQAVPQDGMKMEEEEGQVSFIYAKKEPRPALRFRVAKMAETPAVRFVTVVAPYLGSKPPKVSVKLVGAPQPGDSRVELDVTVGETAARIGYDLKEKKAWLKPL